MKKVVVIGSNGLLGQSLVNRLSVLDQYQVFAMASGENRNTKNKAVNYFEIDINNTNALRIQLNLMAPDFVVNAVAMTNVDACETEKDICDLVNVDFAKNLSNICKDINAHFTHISTDFIFDGVKGLYKESDFPNPINYYGLSKLKSEELVRESNSNSCILRTILVYGRVDNMKRSNIVLWVKKSLEDKTPINIINDQYRMPTFVGSIVDAYVLVMEKQAKGIYHISGNEFLSIYEIAHQVATHYKLETELISVIDSKTLNQKATRPPKTGFVLAKAINELGFQPLSLKEGLVQMDVLN